MFNRLPQLEAFLIRAGQRDGMPYWAHLRGICAAWTIYARYSSSTSTIDAAEKMLARVRLLKELLK
jgi:hypothetical protein